MPAMVLKFYGSLQQTAAILSINLGVRYCQRCYLFCITYFDLLPQNYPKKLKFLPQIDFETEHFFFDVSGTVFEVMMVNQRCNSSIFSELCDLKPLS